MTDNSMTDRDIAEAEAGLKALRATLERRATPGTIEPPHGPIEEECAELANAIEALADERDRLRQELRMAQEQSRSVVAISS